MESSLHCAPSLGQLVLDLVNLVVAGEIKKELLSSKEVHIRGFCNGGCGASGSGEVELSLAPSDRSSGSSGSTGLACKRGKIIKFWHKLISQIEIEISLPKLAKFSTHTCTPILFM